MPLYEFLCTNPKCGHYKNSFDVVVSIFNRDAKITCPTCGCQTRRRIVPSSPASFRMGGRDV